MAAIRQQALVRYSPMQMYALVADIERYPEFLRHCVGARILRREADWVEARLDLHRGPVHQSFATRNSLVPGERIDMQLLEGPFRFLTGHWAFAASGETGCRLSLELEFEMRGPLKFIVTPLISEVAGQMLAAMLGRADRLYGGGSVDVS